MDHHNDYSALIHTLLKLPKECEWVEFKLNFHSDEEIGKDISALANGASLTSKPYAYLIFGIDDLSKSITGTTFKPSLHKVGNNEFENWLMQMLSPKIDFRIHELFIGDKCVALFEIPAASTQPVAFQNIDFIRIGSVSRPLREFPEKEAKIWSKANEIEFEIESCKAGLSESEVIELLDSSFYFERLSLPYPSNRAAVISKFLHEKFITETGSGYIITKLGAVLLAKKLSDFDKISHKAFRVITYKGKNKLQTLKDQAGVKGLAVGFEGMVSYINSQLPSNEEINTTFRKEVRMYPEIAIRELVANAIIHQDFSIKGKGPLVEIYSDRIEISNPGQPLIKPLRFIDENQSRNEKLAAIMRKWGICEEKGSGFDKVVFQSELFQLPAPDIQNSDLQTRVIMFAPKRFAEMDKNDRIRACYQHCVLKYISNDKMVNETVRERFGIEKENAAMASRIISDTLAAELIKEEDPENKSRKFVRYIPYWA